MFKLIYSHKNAKDLTFTSDEFDTFLNSGDIRDAKSWSKVLVIFGFIKVRVA